ncbi:MAG TPA: geranylgeranylglycerol-phosphate geranylgeranyltransferase [Puia sp.]|jgi:4-hydroxybenzoate polyprenyltransferase|nr:geranylgeranylglycerol-phosphate geranylgeranyltransferase [Puia sp.]
MLQLFGAFFRLVRWPNLVFIFLTQLLFYYFIQLPLHDVPGWVFTPVLTPRLFFLLAASSVLIAAAGYIINDYFDLNIDRVNKPKRLVVDRIIKRRWTILWHWILSGLGLLLSFYVSWRLRNPLVALGNLGCVILLYFYSTTFKRKLLIGNVIIALLTAWVILVLYVGDFYWPGFTDSYYRHFLSTLFKFAIVYSSFAFILSLIREVVKDIEDMDGDMKHGCRTMPIVWGVNVAKVFAGTLIVVLLGALVILQFYGLQKAWFPLTLYGVLLVDLPLLWILRKLYAAQTKENYHRLSTIIKLVMLAGILSIILANRFYG